MLFKGRVSASSASYSVFLHLPLVYACYKFCLIFSCYLSHVSLTLRAARIAKESRRKCLPCLVLLAGKKKKNLYIYIPPKSWSGGGLVAKSCLTLCDPMDCSLPGSSVHGILQTWILEWVAMPSSRGSSWPMDWTQVSGIAGGFFTNRATMEALKVENCSIRQILWGLKSKKAASQTFLRVSSNEGRSQDI